MIGRLILLVALALPACGLAEAQSPPRTQRPPAMKAQELKSALFGIRMEGVADGTDFRWRECIDPRGETLYETGQGDMRGRLTITPKGKACFAYEDDNYAGLSCFVMRRTSKGFRFEGDFGANFTTTKVETGVRTCEKQDLIG